MRTCACIFAAMLVAAGISAETEEYTPARVDYGKVNSVWEYTGGGELKAEPGSILIAADIEFPAPPADDRFDLDDIDIFDADTGRNFGSGPEIQRLTPAGEFVFEDDPEVKDRKDYRGIFVWQVPAGVKRVNFGYWGDMLFIRPFVVQKSGRTIPEATAAMSALEGGPLAQQSKTYRGILHAINWYRARQPLGYTLLSTAAAEKQAACECEHWIEVDSVFHPIATPVLKRPYVLKDRYFLMEYRCPGGIQPDLLNHLGARSPLPPLTALKLPASTIDALQRSNTR